MTSSLRQPDYRAFVDALVQLRIERGVTQADLAQALGKPQSFVSKYERGERRIDPAEFRSIAMALGADPGSVFAGVETKLTDPGSKSD